MPNKDRNIPKRRFKEFENADAWELRKLGEVMEVTSVKRIHQSDWTDFGVRFLRARDIVAESKNESVSEPLFISQKKYDEYTAISGKVTKGDLLVTGVGTIGIPMLIEKNEPIYFKDGNIIWFKNENHIDGQFFYYSFIGKKIQSFIKESAGIGTVGTFTINTGKNTPIDLPVLKKEQEAIGTFFSTLDRHITLHQRKLDKLKSVKQAYLSEMFPAEGERVPKRRFPGFTDDWERRPLGEIGNTYTGLSGKTKDDFGHGDGRFVTYMNVFSNPISLPEMVEAVEIDESQNTVRYGDVLFTTSSETPEEVGMSSVWLENTENTYLNSFCFGFRPVKKVNPYYLAYLLRSSGMRRKISFLAQGISRYNISKTKMMELEISIPNEKEQSAIGTFFSTLDRHITLHQRKLEKLKNLKKALLNELFVDFQRK